SQAEVDNIFGIDLVSKVRCAEGGEGAEGNGEESEEKETAFMLKCHISSDINLLHEGIKRGLRTELEKVSASLGRSAVFTKESLIARLPHYLTVQFVRFFWKRESQQKAKILRRVTYPLVLDVYDFCTPELRAKLDGPRKRLRLADDIKVGLVEGKGKGKEGEADAAGKGEGTGEKEGEKMEVEGGSVAKGLGGAAEGSGSAEGKTGGAAEGAETKGGAGEAGEGKEEGGGGAAMDVDGTASDASASTNADSKSGEATGLFDLTAVLTHKGRSADSGHYVAWVKQESGKWIEFDDEQPIMRNEEEIVNLAGGGELCVCHMPCCHAQ
ncbi:unnamed protein product, partial [Closterium sp. NIES-54]